MVMDTFWISTRNRYFPTNLSSEVLQDRGAVHCSSGADPPVARGASLQMSVDAAHRKLKERLSEWEARKGLNITLLSAIKGE